MIKRKSGTRVSSVSPIDSLCPRASNEELVKILDRLGLLEKASPILKAKGILPTVDITPKTEDPRIPAKEIFKGVVAYVEVRSRGFDISSAFCSRLKAGGGEVSATIKRGVTLVVFKDGRISTFKKAAQRHLPVVTTLWIVESLKCGRSLPTTDFLATDPEIERRIKDSEKRKTESPCKFLLQMIRSAERQQKKLAAEKEGMVSEHLSPLTLQTGNRKSSSRKRLFSTNDADMGQVRPGVSQKCGKGKTGRRVTFISNILSTKRRDSADDFKVKAKPLKTNTESSNKTSSAPNAVPEETPMIERDLSGVESSSSLSVISSASATIPECSNLDFANVENTIEVTDRSSTSSDGALTELDARLSDLVDKEGTDVVRTQSCMSLPSSNVNSHYGTLADANGCADSQVTTPVTKKRGRHKTVGTPLCKNAAKRSKVKSDSSPREDNEDERVDQIVRKTVRNKHNRHRGCDSEAESASNSKLKFLPSMVVTNCDARDKDAVEAIVQKLGGFQMKNEVSDCTSHLICGQQRRTISLLLAMARGCWVLPPKWVYQSLEAGKWLDEHPFELDSYYPAVKRSRLAIAERKTSSENGLLSDLGPVFLGPRLNVPNDKLSMLISLTGGKVVDSVEASSVVIQDASETEKGISGKPTASAKWVLDCISEYRIIPMF